MVRLGLSDSMRSTVSLEDTEPLHTATHRRVPRRTRDAAAAAPVDPLSEQQAAAEPAPLVLPKPLRVIVGGILCVVLLSTSVNVLSSSLGIWRRGTSRVEERFERLERSVSLLGETQRASRARATSSSRAARTRRWPLRRGP